MKKHKVVLASLCVALVIFACSKKIVTNKDAAPAASAETTPSEPSKSTAEVKTMDETLVASGKTIYETRCTRCHAMKPTELYTQPRWDEILKIMVPKANLTEQEARQVTTYLKANAKK